MGDTIEELKNGFKNKEYTPIEIAEHYLKKIKKDDFCNAFINVFEDRAVRQAKSLFLNSQESVQQLYGIPLSYKDAIDIRQERTTNGSVIHKSNMAKQNARVVNILEGAGSITLGKNNMHEFSAGVTSDNSFYGNVVNPLNSKVTAGGSSSGSAAAVAAGLVVGSICTDTSGSTRIPAACCGVVGFKPTYNSNMMEGITPISSTLDHIGIIAGSVNDARTIATPIVNANGPQRKSLSGIRIGVDRSYFGNNIDSQIDEMMDAVINGFVESGAEATEVDLSFFDGTVPSARVIGTSEVSYFHQKLFKEYGEEFDNQLFISVEKGMEIPAIKYIEALHKQKFCKGKLTEKFQEVDVILTPTMPIVTPEIKRIQDWSMEESIGDCMVRYTQPFNITGNPALSISSRYVINGIPQSFQMVAKHNAENLLFDLGKMYENEFIL